MATYKTRGVSSHSIVYWYDAPDGTKKTTLGDIPNRIGSVTAQSANRLSAKEKTTE